MGMGEKMDSIRKYEPLWGVWYVESLIGEGSFGKVYRVSRQAPAPDGAASRAEAAYAGAESGNVCYAAVKIISIPQDKSEIRRLENQGLDEESIRGFYKALVKDIAKEADLMNRFRGNSNIVSLESCQISGKTDEIGWDILIRMELLKSLSGQVKEKPFSTEEAVRLGIHICRALELCAQNNIIHRDIKPDNIFVSSFGEYKLGDFGIARQIERSMSGLSRKGTYTTMAPEVFRGERYGAGVDIYSLGMVIYSLLNQNRFPFLPDYPLPIMPEDRDKALQRRMSADPLPVLKDVSPELDALVRKACAHNRRDRFADAGEMRRALESIAAAAGYDMGPRPSGQNGDGQSAPKAAGGTIHLLSQRPDITENDWQAAVEPSVSVQEKGINSLKRDLSQDPETPSDNGMSDNSMSDNGMRTDPPGGRKKAPLIVGLSLAAVILALVAAGIVVFLAMNPKGYGISINGQADLVLPSRQEAREVLDELAEYYADQAAADKVTVSSVAYEEEVEIVQIADRFQEKKSKQEALQILINGNPQTMEPYLNVILEGECVVGEEIDFETEVRKDPNRDINTTGTEQEGRKGIRNVTWSFISRNGVFTERTMIGEEVIEAPVKEIILEGSRIVNLSDALANLPDKDAVEVLWQSIQGYWVHGIDFVAFIYDENRRPGILLSSFDTDAGYGYGELKDVKAKGGYTVTLTFYYPAFEGNDDDEFHMEYHKEFTHIVDIDLGRRDSGQIKIKGSGGLIGSLWDGEYKFSGGSFGEAYERRLKGFGW